MLPPLTQLPPRRLAMESQSSEPSRSPSQVRRNSSITLKTMPDERAILLKGDEAGPTPQYGAISTDDSDPPPTSAETRRKLLLAGLKMAVLFVVSTALLLLVLKLALPTLEE